MYDLETALKLRKEKNRHCKRCGNIMSYFSATGAHVCKQCHFTEQDTYGKIKNLLELNPNLSKMELSSMLHMPIRELNQYISDGVLVNPSLF